MKQAVLRQRGYFTAVTTAVVTALVYLPLLKNSFILWDDDEYIIENLHIRQLDWNLVKWAFTGFVQGNWHPLTNLSHALDYALWGLDPFGHHLSNLILHSANTFLVVILVIKVLEQRQALSEGGIIVAAAVTGILFGIHPVHVESVAWAAERKDLLCGFFYLLALVSYINYGGNIRRTTYFHPELLPPLLFFSFALMSKPMAVTLPLVLLIIDRYLLGRIGSWRTLAEAALEKLPFLLLALLVGGYTVIGQHSGALSVPEEFIPLSGRMLVAIRGFWTYLEHIFLPLGLTPIYPYPKANEISPASFQYGFPLAASALLFVSLLKNLRRPVWCQALWLYYLMTLLPVLGLIKVGYQFMADRYVYLPSIAPFMACGIGGAWLWQRYSRTMVARIVAAAGVAIFSALTVLTVQQIAIWRESRTFWTYIIEREPTRFPVAFINRGLAYREKGDYEKALADLDRAVGLEPSEFKAYNNRGLVLTDAGQPERAVADFNRAIALFPKDPSAFFNRGIAYWKLGESERALADFSTVLAMNPEDLKARNNRGLVFQERGELERAFAEYTDALAIRPDDWMTLNNRGLLLSSMGKSDRALTDFNNALQQKPDEGSLYINRGLAYRAMGLEDKALTDFDRAIRLKPEDSRAYNNRALVYAGKGDLVAALRDFTRALDLDPSLAAVYLNRGLILSKSGDSARARKDFEKACELGEQRGCGFLK